MKNILTQSLFFFCILLLMRHETQVMLSLQAEILKVKKDLDVIAEYEFSEALIESLNEFIRELEITNAVLLREGL